MTSARHMILPPLLCLLLVAGCERRTTPSTPEGSVEPPRRAVDDAADATPSWPDALLKRIRRIDENTSGQLGVHIRHLGDGGRADYGDDRPWYLASTIKVPVAIAILEQVEARELSLDHELELKRSDFVDGAGDLIWQEPGGRYSIATLLEKSLRHSDSTATDMLIRLQGEDQLNRRIRTWVGSGFGPVTTILQVRYDAYGELHPGVAELSNMDLISLRNAQAGEARLRALLELLAAQRADLAHDSIDEAFERYYDSERNSATLVAFADLLEKLVSGELLSAEHSERVLDHMRRITTGDKRIRAGLPAETRFAQKTGTQLGRACNMGVVERAAEDGGAIIIVACVRRFDDIDHAERAFQELGRAIGELVLNR